jgi:N-glycosylase/DNA lyase
MALPPPGAVYQLLSLHKSQLSPPGEVAVLEFTVPLSTPFSLEHTMDSGQVFRWQKRGEWWLGQVSGSVMKVEQVGDLLHCVSASEALDSTFVRRYFRLDVDLDHVLASISKDATITNAVERYYGMRILEQEFWECLASFVLATNANIPRIKKMVAAVCDRFGERVEFEGESFSTFPSPPVLAAASGSDLTACGLGYRAPFLKRVAAAVANNEVDSQEIPGLQYFEARDLLLKELLGQKLLLGVGPKVADCVLLYSCGKDEAFPIDVWIARVLASSYPRVLGPTLRKRVAGEGRPGISLSDYDKVSAKVRSYFGAYAGYAQQYLYVAARDEGLD